MKAAPAAQQRLLDLQGIDTTLDQLAHRRRTLPELAEIEQAEARLTALRSDLVRAETEVGDLDREQRKAEADVDQVRQRAARDQQRLESGQGTARDLESLQHEVASLARRQSDLEDRVLEVMERREDADTRRAGLAAEVAPVEAARDDASARRDAAWEEIDAGTAARTAERGAVAAELPPDLLGLYEKVRASSGGTGAAALLRRRCQGCHLELSGTDLAAAKSAAEDEVLRCEECRRILVRTPESGL